ncbi:M23 family metallopeptidase [Brevibacillus porteri]|uniref:M23 family metallopeptidase n=1 Tax=Brevibacillus porteri TaxID=2126350 RepID=UPI003D1AF785
MPLAVRLLIALAPKNRKTLTVLLVILLIPLLFMMFMSSSVVMLTHVPAIEPEDIAIYKEAAMEVFTEYNLMIPWKELVAIDTVRYKQDFSKVSVSTATKLADRFILEVKTKDEEGNIIIYYVIKSLETVVAEMIATGELVEGDLELIKRYLLFPWEAGAVGQPGQPEIPGLPGDYVPLPGGGGLVFPIVGQWVVSDNFKERKNPVTGKWEYHRGIDLASPEGTPIVAAKSGRVVIAGFNEKAGNTVKIDHGDGTATRYLHMYTLTVREGQEVEAGAFIGTVGSTGQSTGPHLHFELHINGKAVNPARYIL